ncbi:hypothetical protein [Vibrio sp. THAF190c]|uniref:hypothetical protein n=1 Tax=Vibrio sp. THAF190c TaxID=2587865 RepID=UPI001267AE9F|nr:hypothetical protein [Vibrio sp. THAF190c]QFT13313.1 hypothetical protein FIV04_25520 [Vibrio sp. THAF190c]
MINEQVAKVARQLRVRGHVDKNHCYLVELSNFFEEVSNGQIFCERDCFDDDNEVDVFGVTLEESLSDLLYGRNSRQITRVCGFSIEEINKLIEAEL